MKYVAPVRKELGIRTVFNILGPLTNPAGATYQVMGVYDEALVEPLAQVLSNLGVKRAMDVYGKDGLVKFLHLMKHLYVKSMKEHLKLIRFFQNNLVYKDV